MSLVKRVIYKKETVEANRNKRRKRHGVGGGGISWAEMADIEINRSIGILQHVLCTSFFFFILRSLLISSLYFLVGMEE